MRKGNIGTALFIGLLATLGGGARTAGGSPAAPGATPVIGVRVQSIGRDGRFLGNAWAGDDFSVGRVVTLHLSAGLSNPSEMNLCGIGAGDNRAWTLDQALMHSSFVWKVSIVPLNYEKGNETFDLRWERYQFDHGPRTPVAQGKQTVTLAEGQRLPIDLPHGQETQECSTASVLVDIGAKVKEDPKLAQTMLQYDLWLTHREADGTQAVRHFTAMGAQGAEVAYTFVPLRFAVPREQPRQPVYDIVTSVLGAVRGRLQPDGRVAVRVNTTRWDGLGRPGEAADGMAGNEGSKSLELGLGEAIEIELPPPGGHVSKADVSVQFAQFFKDQRTSLVLQVRRVG